MNDPKENKATENNIDTKYRIKAAAFLTIIGGIGVLAGFSGAVAAVKKQDPSHFDQGLAKSKSINQVYLNRNNKQIHRRGKHINSHQIASELNQSGAALAVRALGYGSLFAVLGCSALFFTIWKLTGAKDLKDFRIKAGSILPRIPKNDPPVGRTEFTGINDFLTYVIEEDNKKKNTKRDN